MGTDSGMGTRFSGSTGTGENWTNRPEPPAYCPVGPGKTATGKDVAFQPDRPENSRLNRAKPDLFNRNSPEIFRFRCPSLNTANN